MSAAVVPLVIGTLSREAIYAIAWTWGPPAVSWLYGLVVQREVGQAATQQKIAFREMQEGIHRFLQLIEQKEIRVVPGAFNSTPNFIHHFQTAAMGGIALAVLDVAQAIRRVGASLESIRSELAITNVMYVQGWGDDGFGGYIHRFVRNEMAAFDGTRGDEDETHHYFYIWHPDNDWYTAFEERQAGNPLGPNFGGYHHELPTLCLRMRADREALIETTDYGRTAIFHLVIPTYQPLVVDTPFTFAEELFPLVITGARHRGVDLAWLALRQSPDAGRLELNFVSILPDTSGELGMFFYMGCLVCWVGSAACAIAKSKFPQCDKAVRPLFWTGTASAVTGVASDTYEGLTRPTVQVLGEAVFLV